MLTLQRVLESREQCLLFRPICDVPRKGEGISLFGFHLQWKRLMQLDSSHWDSGKLHSELQSRDYFTWNTFIPSTGDERNVSLLSRGQQRSVLSVTEQVVSQTSWTIYFHLEKVT